MIEFINFLILRTYQYTILLQRPFFWFLLFTQYYSVNSTAKNGRSTFGRLICYRCITSTTNRYSKSSSGKLGQSLIFLFFYFTGHWSSLANEKSLSFYCFPNFHHEKHPKWIQFCASYQLAASNIPENSQQKTSINM